MVIATAPKQLAPAGVPEDLVMRLSVAQYHKMIARGIVNSATPVELLDGFLIAKLPKSPPHRVTTYLLRRMLEKLLARCEWYVGVQEPITLADSEPEPDLSVVRGDTRQYFDRHPGASDVAFVVEVAEATLKRDQRSKKRVYAQAGITEYWIVNLIAHQIEVYTLPGEVDGAVTYQSRQDYRRGASIPVILEGNEIGQIAVSQILP
jgi:Uma2 family endonuclease